MSGKNSQVSIDPVMGPVRKVRGVRPLAVSAALVLAMASPVSAFECTNAGAGGSANDTNDGDALACGSGAVSGGLGSTAVGDAADSDGLFSVAVGKEAMAAGALATSAGYQATAPLSGSTAFGGGASAAGLGATAIGLDASAAGEGSVALGDSAISSADDGTIAIGDGANASGPFAIAIGGGASASKPGTTPNAGIAIGKSTVAINEGVALGNFAEAGSSSVAIGFGVETVGSSTVAIGSYANGNAHIGTAIGYQAQVDKEGAVVLGRAAGFNSADGYADVGIGTTAPDAPLHIFRNDSTQEFMLLESDEHGGGTQDRAMMFLANNGGIRFEFANQSLGTSWRFQAATGAEDRFEVTKVGTGKIEMALDASGNLELQGMVMQLSDREAKQNLSPVVGEDVLARLEAMPISEWSYKDDPDARHLGPMAQDFRAAFGLGKDDRHLSSGDLAGVSLAAIKALADQNRALQVQNDDLHERLELLESTVMQLLPSVADR